MDKDKEISLADNTYIWLIKYAHILINMMGIQVIVKYYIITAMTYDILLGVWWMRWVRMISDFGEGKVSICGKDGVWWALEVSMAPIECQKELLTVKINEEDDINDVL